jgi:hypothetical protein
MVSGIYFIFQSGKNKFQVYVIIGLVSYLPKVGGYVASLYPRKQSWGVYRNHPVRPSVRLSMYLVSATPPKRLIGFL